VIGRLIVFIFLWAAALALGAAGLVKGVQLLFGDSIRKWKNRRLGVQNAKRLEAHVDDEEECCCICLRTIDPQLDLYSRRHGWMHARCYSEILSREET